MNTKSFAILRPPSSAFFCQSVLAGVALLTVGAYRAEAQTQTPTTITPVSVTLTTTAATPYTQNFNTLATTTSSTLPAGFGFVESGSNANATYSAGTGSGTTGDTYSFGTAAAPTDRAFGTLQSGTLISTVGGVFTNNTGQTITSLTLSYTGEQYRLGTAGRADRLDFQFNGNTADLSTGTFTDYDTLDFNSPNTTTTGALDGNAAANRTALSFTIPGLLIPDGQSFAFRLVDFNAAGADDGLAIDDFSLSLAGFVAAPEPATVLSGFLALGALGWSLRRRLNAFAGQMRMALAA